MVSEALIKIWMRQGLNKEQIIAKAKEKGEELPDYFYLSQDINRDRYPRTKSGDVIKHFRPNPDVLNILIRIQKGRVSRFVNSAIIYYYKNYYSKED